MCLSGRELVKEFGGEELVGGRRSQSTVYSQKYSPKAWRCIDAKCQPPYSYEDIDAMESPDKVSESMRRKERRL